MAVHELKTTSSFFQDVKKGIKPFEVRLNDRDFKKGDILRLREIDDSGSYTEDFLERKITYVMTNENHPGIHHNYIVMGLSKARKRLSKNTHDGELQKIS